MLCVWCVRECVLCKREMYKMMFLKICQIPHQLNNFICLTLLFIDIDLVIILFCLFCEIIGELVLCMNVTWSNLMVPRVCEHLLSVRQMKWSNEAMKLTHFQGLGRLQCKSVLHGTLRQNLHFFGLSFWFCVLKFHSTWNLATVRCDGNLVQCFILLEVYWIEAQKRYRKNIKTEIEISGSSVGFARC